MPLYYYKCDEECAHTEEHFLNFSEKDEKTFTCPKCKKELKQDLGFQGFLMRNDRTRDGMKV